MSHIEKPDIVGTAMQLEETGSSQVDLKASTVENERAELLANLPDPDAGKSDEEKKALDKKLMWKVDLWLVPWLSFL